MTVRVEGIEKTVAMLGRLEAKARRRVATAGVRAGNKEIIKTARAMAPVDTGLLRSQIRQSIRLDSRTGIVRGTVQPKRTKNERIKKGLAHGNRYLHLVVHGTRPHTIGGPSRLGDKWLQNLDHPGARANPFMDRTAAHSARAAIREFSRAFNAKMQMEINQEGSR